MKSILIDYAITDRADPSLRSYLNEIDKLKLIGPQEEVALSDRIRQGDQAALDKLVRSNLRFVVSCAKKYQHMGLPLVDLINEGNLGLIKAARMFDPTKGFKFISYAVWWIRQSIMSALSHHARAIRLPLNMVKATSELRRASEKLEGQLQRMPTYREICEQVHIPNENLTLDYAFGASLVSLDDQLAQDGQSELWSSIPDNNSPAADHLLERENQKADLQRLFSVIDHREQKILSDFFGISGELPKDLDDIASELGLCRERVRQMKKAALQKIRDQHGERSNSFV